MKKRIVALLLVAVMLLSMTACGAKPSAETKQATHASSNESATPSNEPITLTTAMVDDGSNGTWLEGEDITNNWWTRQYKERFNIDVVTDWYTSDWDTFATKLNMAIVNKDLPDTVRVETLTQLEDLVDAGLVMDLSDVWDKYACDELKALAEADPDTFGTGYLDGGLYGIAQLSYGWSSYPYYVWLRSDWMEEQGFEAPQTMDELVNIMKTFKEVYGGYGLAADKTLYSFYALAGAWGAYPSIWVTNDGGTMEPGAIQPEMKDALATFAEWYSEGLIDPNFTTYDMAAMNTGVASGKVGAEIYQQWWGYNPGADVVKELGEDAIFLPYIIPAATTEWLHSVNFVNSGYTVISKDCAHPEAVIELMNFVYYANYTLDIGDDAEVQEFRTNSDMQGYTHVTGPFRMLDPTTEDQNLVQVTQAIETGDTSCLTLASAQGKYNGSMKWIENKDPSGLGDYLQHGAGKFAAFRLADTILSEGRYVLDGLWGKTPEIMSTYGSTLDDLLLEGFTKIIIGDKDVSYFDELVANWRSAGGDDVIKAVNEMYKG